MSKVEFGVDGCMKWVRLNPPYYWDLIEDFILADRFLPDGTRQLMVSGFVPQGALVNNAQIIGSCDPAGQAAEFQEIKFDGKFSGI